MTITDACPSRTGATTNRVTSTQLTTGGTHVGETIMTLMTPSHHLIDTGQMPNRLLVNKTKSQYYKKTQ